jgi:hypothetical protein
MYSRSILRFLDVSRVRYAKNKVFYILAVSLGVFIHVELPYDQRSESSLLLCWLTTFIAISAWYLIQNSNPGVLKSSLAMDYKASSAAAGSQPTVQSPRSFPCLWKSWSYKRLGDDEEEEDGGLLVVKQDSDSYECCEYCGSERIARSHHCRRCNHCVAQFDHHCNFLGICIGERNHGLFYAYLITETICCLVALQMISLCWRPYEDVYEMVAKNFSIIVVRLTLLGLLFSIVSLLVFHTWLVIFNVTTYEVITLSSSEVPLSAYSEGIVTNTIKFCLTMQHDYGMSCASSEWKPIDWRYHRRQLQTREKGCSDRFCVNDIYECC